MRLNSERAETMKRSHFDKENRAGCGRMPVFLRRLVSSCLMGFTLIIGAFCLSPNALGQPSATPTPLPANAPVVVKVSTPETYSALYRFSGDKLQKQTRIEFVGNDQDLSFLQFDELPQGVSLKTDGPVKGYQNPQLQAGKWYWFRTKLPLILEIQGDVQAPLGISYWFGGLKADDKAQAEAIKPEDMQGFVDRHLDAFQKNPERLTLGFTWGAAGAAPRSSVSSSPESTPGPSPGSSWITYFVDEEPLYGIGLLVLLLVVVLLVAYFAPDLVWRIRHRPKNPKHQTSSGPKRKTQTSRSKPTSEPDYSSLGGGVPSDADLATTLGLGREDRPPYISAAKQPGKEVDENAGDQYRRPEPSHAFSPLHKPSTRSAPPIAQDGKLAQLEKRVNTLEDKLGEKVDRHERLTQAAELSVQDMLRQQESNILAQVDSKFRQVLINEVKPVEQLMNDTASSLSTELEKTTAQIAQLSSDDRIVKEQLTQLFKEMGEFEQRLKDRVKEFEDTQRKTDPDSFYVRTLGAVLGQNVETLREGNFERLIGERVNQFFQTGVDRAEALPELRARVDGINAAVKRVASHIEKLNAEAYDEVRPRLQEIENLVTDISNMQSQLQDRRTVLHIPVSLHAGARQTFLDGLGRGVKREIEKLDDPVSYFASELERLITADLIAVVEICDKRVAPPPGSRPELEAALKQLLDQADLRSILPRHGEPFRVAEQDLIQMTEGGSSLTVAQVVTRGFYYKHREKETLLRKAGVMVYR